MKRLLFAVVSLILCISCNYTTKEEVLKELEEHEWDILDHKEWPYVYYVNNSNGDSGWVTYNYYMWNYGFPDTIIVKFTRDGEFEQYVEARKWDIVEDSFDEHLTPSYMFITGVGDSWEYDLSGNFINFNCCDAPHSGAPHKYNP